MKTKTTKTTAQNKKEYVDQIAIQIEMALNSEKAADGVKDCIRTIIIEAATEADMTINDFSLIRAEFPRIIENLNEDYGRGFLHSVAAIIRYDTDAFQSFYDERLDENAENPNDMSRIENAAKFITDLEMSISNDQELTARLMMLFNAIAEKSCLIDVKDFCDSINDHLYNWTSDQMYAKQRYIDKVKQI